MSYSFSINLIICTYNNASLLNRTIEDLYLLQIPAQTQWSILVVNNNCTDETASIVQNHVTKAILPLSTIIETKQGLTAARVCGVNNTKADWIAFIDDDCLLAADWLTEVQKFIPAHPSCGLFGSRIQLLWEEEPPKYVAQFPFAYAAKNHGDAAKQLQAVAGAGMVVKRDALEKCGWTTKQFLADRVGKKLVSGGDMEIALRVGSHHEVWYNPNCRLKHIIPKNRTTKKYLQRMVFGLGASRHNVAALNWKGSYPSWLLYSSAYSLGMLALSVVNAINKKQRAAGLKVAFGPSLGWYAAMLAMLRMNTKKRNALLGCTKKQVS